MVTGVFLCLSVLPGLIAIPLSATADDSAYTPFITRDQNLLNMIHGQSLPVNASLLPPAQSLWSTSLGITNAINIESGVNESIYLDYESYRLNLSWQYGLNRYWNIKLDAPLLYQSGEIFDSAINVWHQFFGMPQGKRPQVENNQYQVSYSGANQNQLDLSESRVSLADIQLAAGRTLLKNNDTGISLWGSLKLPTGDKNKLSGSGAADVSAWLALNQRLADSWLINTNAGLVIPGQNDYQGMKLADTVWYGHIMLGWLFNDTLHFKLQLQGHTSYYPDSRTKILGDTYFLAFGGSINLNRCHKLDIAVSEDIKVDASPDISLLLNWRYYTSGC